MVPVNGYNINEAGQITPWSFNEEANMTAFASLLPNAGAVVCDPTSTTQHMHSKLRTSDNAYDMIYSTNDSPPRIGYGRSLTAPLATHHFKTSTGSNGICNTIASVLIDAAPANNAQLEFTTGLSRLANIYFSDGIAADQGLISYDFQDVAATISELNFTVHAQPAFKVRYDSAVGHSQFVISSTDIIPDSNVLLTVWHADSGGTANGGTSLLLESHSDTQPKNLEFLMNNTAGAMGVWFSDNDANGQGKILYNHATDAMTFNVNGTEVIGIASTGRIGLGNGITAASALDIDNDAGGAAMGYITIEELNVGADAAAPLANKVVIYARDNGAGKTQLMARFATGAVQQIAIQP